MLLLILDRYHLGDPLFLSGLARDLRTRRPPLILVHGTTDEAERRLEGAGREVTRAEGLLAVADEEQAGWVESSLREANRQIAHTLNEAGVPAMRLLAADRGLFSPGATGWEAGHTRWLLSLAQTGTVPVLGAWADAELHPVAVAGALARAWAEAAPVVVALTTDRRAGVWQDGQRLARWTPSVAPGAVLDAGRWAVEVAAGTRVLVTHLSGLFHPEGIQGTYWEHE